MTRVTPGMVYEKAVELLSPVRGGGAASSTALPVIA
jgi:hypothetical protein